MLEKPITDSIRDVAVKPSVDQLGFLGRIEVELSVNTPGPSEAVRNFWANLENPQNEVPRDNNSIDTDKVKAQNQIETCESKSVDKGVCGYDDNGNVYCSDGKLEPNFRYELNGNIYTTDDKGRIISCEAKPVLSPENPRDNDAQRQAGGEDRRPNDQGGHIVGRDMNGDGGAGNLVAMDSKINQSDYKRMENDIKDALREGKEVTTKTEFSYSGDSERPDKITVTVTIDGKDTVYKFDNNLDGSLRDEVPENGKAMVQDRLADTGGEISSIKEEYDEARNLVETTVCITYEGDGGTTYRTSVVIDKV